jgi:Spy/CpxP family protein refolding chaperone
LFAAFVLVASFAGSSAQAAQGGGGRGRGQDPIAYILQHSKDLNITDEQKTKLDAIEKDIQSARPKGQNADRTEYQAKMKDAQEKVTAILNKEQQEKLTALKDKAAADKEKAAGDKKPAQ